MISHISEQKAIETRKGEFREKYQREGYVIARNAVGMHEMNWAKASLQRMIDGLEENHRPEYLIEPHVRAPDAEDWLRFCSQSSVCELVQEVLEADEIVLLMSHLIVKMPFDGLPICWHQDNSYWPHVHGHDIATCWLALEDVDLENACMQVMPRSQRGHRDLEKIPTDGGDLLGVRVDVTEDEIQSAVPVELKTGDMSLHDSFIIHGSEENRSARRRAGYTMRYANAKTCTFNPEKHHVPIYYLRGDGSSLMKGMVDQR